MTFRITGLSPEPFQFLFGLPDDELARQSVKRYVADKPQAFPCRVEMRDAAPGETVLLLNHVCQPADTPYRASHAIFVREGAAAAYNRVDEVPAVMRARLLSLRAFDADGMMVDADVVDGAAIEPLIARLLANADVSYIHAHYAKRGCYSGRIDRA
ncbi:MAG: DUF1203 domain-containing protein [Roseiarcus sp.]|jgi:hypothetical protein